MRLLLSLLLLLFAGSVAAQDVDSRTLSLATQDRNGMFMLTVIAFPDRTKATIRNFFEPEQDPPIVDYPKERFEQLWRQADALDLERFAVVNGSGDIEPAFHYVVTVMQDHDGQRRARGYRIPKCGIAPELDAFVQAMANGLLPPGSPGLFKPCAPPATAADPAPPGT